MKKFKVCVLAVVATCVVFSCGSDYESRLTVQGWDEGLKLGLGSHNPLIDFQFTADPTAVEYEGRLYVYGTNDQQQFEQTERNTYEKINTLAMMSTTDMVNWTWHGVIPTGELAPWIIASWAPSIVSRVEEDGLTHFYLYYSNSGFGTGVLTSTSPVGPWTSPLEKSLVDQNTPGLGNCDVPFDPGVDIDADGNGWIAVGGGPNARIARLAPDMISFASEFATLPVLYHFEANEINFLDGKCVYTYNMDWSKHEPWPLDTEIPRGCCMAYMTSSTPLDSTSWKFEHAYFSNPGDFGIKGIEHSNNHTHLHQYKGHWYLLYHTMDLQKHFGTHGGFRNVSVDEINVDGTNIGNCTMTREGVAQLENPDAFSVQQIETSAGTMNVSFKPEGDAGNMILACSDSTSLVLMRGVNFSHKPRRLIVRFAGQGDIEFHASTPDGTLIAGASVSSAEYGWTELAIPCATRPKGITDICILSKGSNLKIDSWHFR